MKFEVKNENYCATIIKVHSLTKLNGLDKLVGIPAFGFQALVSNDTEVGQLGILFTAETQLSNDFCCHNNLYRHQELNVDKSKTGYIDGNRRIRSIKFRNNISSALFMPLSSLSYLGIDTNNFKEGDTFTHINDIEICSKYIIKEQKSSSLNKQLSPKKKRVDDKLIPEHIKTIHWLKVCSDIDDETDLVVTAKLHGTSARFANQICLRKLTYFEKWLKWFGFEIKSTEYDYFACSRRVIKDLNNKNQAHYYNLDIWNQALEPIRYTIPKNWIIYGEIVGWVGEKPIQHSYTYQIPKGEFRFYVYRIAIVNSDGVSCDLGWNEVKKHCINNGLMHVPEIWAGKKKNLDIEQYKNKRFVQDLGFKNCLPLDRPDLVDEGVVLRVGEINPVFYKFKSPDFLVHETGLLDKGEIDIESAESEE